MISSFNISYCVSSNFQSIIKYLSYLAQLGWQR